MQASPRWKLLWQTLTSQWFFFYLQCNRAGWAQPLTGSHWCAPFQPTLFLGNRCCSTIAWCLRGPIHKQTIVNEWLLAVLLSCWAALQWTMPTGYGQWGTIGEAIKSRVVWWHSGGDWGKRQTQAFFQRPWSSCRLGPVGELAGPGNSLGTTCCSALSFLFAVCLKGGVACISEVIDSSPGNLPACASSSLAFLMMYSAYKLNKQDDNIQP